MAAARVWELWDDGARAGHAPASRGTMEPVSDWRRWRSGR